MLARKTVLVIAGLMLASTIGVTLLQYPSVSHVSSFTVSIDAKEPHLLPHLTMEQSTRATSVYDGRQFVPESVSKVTETNITFVNKHLIQKVERKLKLKGMHNSGPAMEIS